MKRCRVRYEGCVQGVGFRVTAVRQSTGLNVHGFVRNEPDGSVLMDVEGGQTKTCSNCLTGLNSKMRGDIEASFGGGSSRERGHSGGFKIQY